MVFRFVFLHPLNSELIVFFVSKNSFFKNLKYLEKDKQKKKIKQSIEETKHTLARKTKKEKREQKKKKIKRERERENKNKKLSNFTSPN